jgi:hypothetical protein
MTMRSAKMPRPSDRPNSAVSSSKPTHQGVKLGRRSFVSISLTVKRKIRRKRRAFENPALYRSAIAQVAIFCRLDVIRSVI